MNDAAQTPSAADPAVAKPAIAKMINLAWFADAVGAQLQGADAQVQRVNIDSRSAASGDLFVALRGERFDGHAFAAGAASAGAVGILCERQVDQPLAQIVVKDSLEALQAASRAWRQRFTLPLVAVTGSNGKTTTKQMLAAIFASRGAVLATRGNFNNHIGMPLTLLELREQHRTAVIEMGANHPGEIALLTSLAIPDVAVITQAGDAHLDGFGSREGVARAKGELIAGLSADGIAVINADDAFAPLWRSLASGRQLSFGIEQAADVRATAIRSVAPGSRFQLEIPGSEAPVALALPGRHNIMNALAAAACAAALGMEADEIAQGLARIEPAQGRVIWKQANKGARVIDDSYNANPTSMLAGLELLAQQSGQRWAVLGGMAELGADSAALHEWCGAKARELKIERLCTLGDSGRYYARGFGAGAEQFDELDALLRALEPDLARDVSVLVKGSRAARMERVVAALCGDASAETH